MELLFSGAGFLAAAKNFAADKRDNQSENECRRRNGDCSCLRTLGSDSLPFNKRYRAIYYAFHFYSSFFSADRGKEPDQLLR
jgi:hypothetical protein